MTLKTIRDCAQTLGISESRLRRAVASGKTKALRLGNRMLVDTEDARRTILKPKGVKIQTVMERTGLTASAIRRGVHEGWLPCAQRGKPFLFDMDDVEAAIRQRMEDQNTQE